MKKVFFTFYLFLVATIATLQWCIGPMVTHLWMSSETARELVISYDRKLARGLYFLLDRDLSPFPQKEWPQRMAELRPHFGYPVSLVRIEATGLSGGKMDGLLRGAIVVKGNVRTVLFQRVGRSDYALRMDVPRQRHAPLAWQLELWAVVACAFALITFIWSIPFYRSLLAIRRAAVDFGNGRLESRVKIARRSSLAVIGAAFNDMAARLVELIDSQKDLVRAVSHELRTPIARIRFRLEMIRCSPDRASVDLRLADMEADIDELNELVAELLSYHRFDHNAHALHLEKLALLTWVEPIVHGLAAVNETLAISCSAQHPCDAGLLDPRLMGRAVGNLVQNAVLHARSRVEIRVSTDREGACTIHVDDDGPGNPVQDRERVFKPFVRLDPSRDRDSGGHGLGLAIVRQVVALHGGWATVADSPLGGARFTLHWRIGQGSAVKKGNPVRALRSDSL